MNMFKGLVRKTIPLVAFGVGLFGFPENLRSSKFGSKQLITINENKLAQIEQTEEYKQLKNNKQFERYYKSDTFPDQHRSNYVSSGLLFGPDLFEIDPIVFINKLTGELISFYHLGDKLISQDGQIHNGVVSTILDEGLCGAGFPLLPSKRGVTAKLSIDFRNQAPPNSTVMLKAKVVELKGRKVIIHGYLQTLPIRPTDEKIIIADSDCILVEPKWFKYFKWFN